MSDIQNLQRMQEEIRTSRIAQDVSDKIEQEQQTVSPTTPITEKVDAGADPGTLSRAFDAFGKVMGAYQERIRPIQLPFIWGSLGAQRAFGDYEEGQLPPGYKESMPAWFGGELPMGEIFSPLYDAARERMKSVPRFGVSAPGLLADEVMMIHESKQEKLDKSRKEGLSMEERLALTDLPWGVMGAIELLVDPLNFIGGTGAYSKLLKLPKKIPTKTAREIAEDISAGRSGVERSGVEIAAREVAEEASRKGYEVLPGPIKSLDDFASMGKSPAWVKGIAQKSGMVAVGLTKFIRHINPSAVAVTPEDKGLVGYNRMLEFGDRSWVAMKSAFERKFEAFDIAPDGTVKNVRVRDDLDVEFLDRAEASNIQDVLERTGTRANDYDDGWYVYTDAQKDLLSTKEGFVNDMERYLIDDGIPFTPVKILDRAGEVRGGYFPRVIEMSRGNPVTPLRNPFVEERMSEYAVDVVRNGGRYEANPTMILETYYKATVHAMADQRLANVVKPLQGIGVKAYKNGATIQQQRVYDDALDLLTPYEQAVAILAKAISKRKEYDRGIRSAASKRAKAAKAAEEAAPTDYVAPEYLTEARTVRGGIAIPASTLKMLESVKKMPDAQFEKLVDDVVDELVEFTGGMKKNPNVSRLGFRANWKVTDSFKEHLKKFGVDENSPNYPVIRYQGLQSSTGSKGRSEVVNESMENARRIPKMSIRAMLGRAPEEVNDLGINMAREAREMRRYVHDEVVRLHQSPSLSKFFQFPPVVGAAKVARAVKAPKPPQPLNFLGTKNVRPKLPRATLGANLGKWTPLSTDKKKWAPREISADDVKKINEALGDKLGGRIEDIIEENNPGRIRDLYNQLNDRLLDHRTFYNGEADKLRKLSKENYMIGPNEAVVRNRAFADLVMPKSLVKRVESYVRPQLNPILKGASSLASMSRTLGTTIDWGWIGIQGVLLAHTQPVIFSRAVKNMFQSTFSSNVVRRYFANPETRAAAEEGVRYGLHLDETAEMVEAARRGAPLERFVRGIPVAGRILSPAMEGFQRAFTFAGNYARIEMWQAMRPMIAAKYGDNVDEARKGLEELADFINKGTGVMSTRHLGISPAQQAFEAVLLFSPRYTRATIGLFSDTLQGGMSGQLARNSLAKMTAAGTLWYTALSYAMGEEPKLDPRPSENGGDGAKFMTIKIAGTNVGIGGNILSLIRLQAHVLATLVDDPSAFANVLDTKDQPFSRYLRGKMSPIGSAGIDIATGKTYMGESTLDSPMNFLANVVRPRMIPFWAESVLFESPTGGPGLSGEFFGARTFPVSLWDKRNEARQSATEEYMKEAFPENAEGEWWETDDNNIPIEGDPVKFESLDPLMQEKILIQYPEVRELEQKARDQNVDRRDEVGEALNDYRTRKEEFHDELTEALFSAESQILNQPAGSIKGRTFRDKYDLAMSIYYDKSKSLRGREEYDDLWDYLDTREGEKPQNLAAFALGEYMENVIADPDLHDRYGNFNYNMYEGRREDFRLDWGDAMLAYVDEYRNLTRTKVPAMAASLEKLRSSPAFKGYWNSHNAVLDTVGLVTEVEKEMYLEYVSSRQIMKDEILKTHPNFRKIQNMVGAVRVKLREKNKVLDGGLYQFGYTDTVRHSDNKGRELAILAYGVKDKGS